MTPPSISARLRGIANRLRQAREIATFRRATQHATLLAVGLWTVVVLGPPLFHRAFGVPVAAGWGFVAVWLLLFTVVARAASGPWGVPARPNTAAGVAGTLLYLSTLIAPPWLAIALWLGAAIALGQGIGLSLRLVERVVPTALQPTARGWLATSMTLSATLPLLSLWQLTTTGVRVAVGGAAVTTSWAGLAVLRLHRDHLTDFALKRARDAAQTNDQADRPLLEVADVEVSYGPVQVLFGVDLQVHAGEVVGLLGTNGAGKSTVLKAIAGHLRPSRGSIRVDGVDVTGMLPDELARHGVALVPGGRAVFRDLSVDDNLRMGAFLEHDAERVRATTARIFALFPQLLERRSTLAGALSGGEQQMLAIAQTLYLRPRVLMIDELSLGLAPTVVADLLEVVRALAAEGVGIVLVEQSVNVALKITDRVVFLEKGTARFEGPAADLLQRPDVLRSVFLQGAEATLRTGSTVEAA